MGFLFGGSNQAAAVPAPVAPDPAAVLAQQQAAAKAAALQARQAGASASGRASTESTKSGALGVAATPLGATPASTLY